MKNTNAKNADWLPIVTSLGLTILSDFLDDPLYTKIMTAIMILVLIYAIIRGVITTRYSIKTEDPNIKTWISIKVDYWLLFVRNMIFYGFLTTLFFCFYIFGWSNHVEIFVSHSNHFCFIFSNDI